MINEIKTSINDFFEKSVGDIEALKAEAKYMILPTTLGIISGYSSGALAQSLLGKAGGVLAGAVGGIVLGKASQTLAIVKELIPGSFTEENACCEKLVQIGIKTVSIIGPALIAFTGSALGTINNS